MILPLGCIRIYTQNNQAPNSASMAKLALPNARMPSCISGAETRPWGDDCIRPPALAQRGPLKTINRTCSPCPESSLRESGDKAQAESDRAAGLCHHPQPFASATSN
jgi:hypothetical protein